MKNSLQMMQSHLHKIASDLMTLDYFVRHMYEHVKVSREYFNRKRVSFGFVSNDQEFMLHIITCPEFVIIHEVVFTLKTSSTELVLFSSHRSTPNNGVNAETLENGCDLLIDLKKKLSSPKYWVPASTEHI